MDHLKHDIDGIRKRKSVNGSQKFSGESTWPFSGEHLGKRLKNISRDFWISFFEEHRFEAWTGRDLRKAAQYSASTAGKLLAYAKRRIDYRPDFPLKKGYFFINNGTLTRQWNPAQRIPEGFVRGHCNRISKPLSEEHRKSVSEGVKAYNKTPEGQALIKARNAATAKRNTVHMKKYWKSEKGKKHKSRMRGRKTPHITKDK